jgi:hypothetical protein
MQTLPRNINPFALMLDPQAVIAQIERSERLEGLHRRVCRPLDKPLLGNAVDEAAEGADLAAGVAGADDDSGAAAESAVDDPHNNDPRGDGQYGDPWRHD